VLGALVAPPPTISTGRNRMSDWCVRLGWLVLGRMARTGGASRYLRRPGGVRLQHNEAVAVGLSSSGRNAQAVFAIDRMQKKYCGWFRRMNYA
jgi:hypothetical protein